MVSPVPMDFTASLARKRMAAGVLFRDSADRVLLVEPTYKPHWENPGGSVEAEESPYAGVGRELQEELGLSVPVGRLLVVDWVPSRPHRTEAVLFVFDGGVLGPEETERIRLPEQELRSWAWCTPAEVHERAHELLARRPPRSRHRNHPLPRSRPPHRLTRSPAAALSGRYRQAPSGVALAAAEGG